MRLRVREQLSRLDPRARWTIALIGVVVALNVIAVVLDAVTGGAGSDGPDSSSYTTGPRGLAAYAELLSSTGHDVARFRTTPSLDPLDPAATAILLDPSGLEDADISALKDFLRRGGRLVAGGSDPEWINDLVTEPLAWDPEGATTARALVPVPETAGVAIVQGRAAGSWGDAAGTLPVLGGDRPTVTVMSIGEGHAVLLADVSPLTNEFLDRADNAAFALGAVGSKERPIYFVESVHGYGESGFYAIPSRIRWLVAGLTLAALAWMVARGKRLGAPQEASRPLPPARKEYVDALASVLRRTKQRGDAIQPLRRRARAVLAARAGVSDADDAALRASARDAGLSERQIRALFDPIVGDDALIAAGEAFVSITKGEV